jgi:ABC-type sugar transport system substrate-binding protein
MKKHRIIVSLITVDNDFQLEQAAAAEEAARRLEVDLEILFADGDTSSRASRSSDLCRPNLVSDPTEFSLSP